MLVTSSYFISSGKINAISNGLKTRQRGCYKRGAPQKRVPYGIVRNEALTKEPGAKHLEAVDGRIVPNQLLAFGRQPVHHEERPRQRQHQVLQRSHEALGRVRIL